MRLTVITAVLSLVLYVQAAAVVQRSPGSGICNSLGATCDWSNHNQNVCAGDEDQTVCICGYGAWDHMPWGRDSGCTVCLGKAAGTVVPNECIPGNSATTTTAASTETVTASSSPTSPKSSGTPIQTIDSSGATALRPLIALFAVAVVFHLL